MQFEDITRLSPVFLYAGDVPDSKEYRTPQRAGLSLTQDDNRHIPHDIRLRHPIPDNTVDTYQAEDVFEHIEYAKLPGIIADIYRILKKGGLFRLSVPDYRCDVLRQRSIRNASGDIVFDSDGGGVYRKRYFFFGPKVATKGAHLWFPTYETVKALFEKIPFSSVEFLHWYGEDGAPHCNPIDYSKGFIQRTPDHDVRVAMPYRPMSLVVDCIK